MKKMIPGALCALFLSSFANTASAQWTTSGNFALTDGSVPITRVGIQDNNPAFPLTVNGTIGYTAGSSHRYLSGNTNTTFAVYSNDGWTNGSGIMLNSLSAPIHPGSVTFVSNGVNGNANSFEFVTWDNTLANPTWKSRMIMDQVGRLSIGENIPVYDKLTVGGSLCLYEPISTDFRSIRARAYNAGLAIYANEGWGNGGGIMLSGGGTQYGAGSIDFIATEGSGTYETAFTFRTAQPSGGWNDPFMTLTKEGRVTIGENVPIFGDYKLYVKGAMMAEKIKVALSNSGDWSDYVFAEDYSLAPLHEVQNYIKENKHLPGVPSADEVAENGIDVGAMDATLLKKIEELTLYILKQQEEINELKTAIKK